MAQHDYNIANQSASASRTDINNVLGAIVSLNAGAAAPTNTFAHMLWSDTTNNLLKMRNAADTAWLILGKIDQTNNRFEPYTDKIHAASAAGTSVYDSSGGKLLDLLEATSSQATTGTDQYAVMTARRTVETVHAKSGWAYVETAWDNVADGSVSTIDTAAFVDGFEYLIVGTDVRVSQNGTYVGLLLQKESDSSYVPPIATGVQTTLVVSTGKPDRFSFEITVMAPRVSADVHLVRMASTTFGSKVGGSDSAGTITGITHQTVPVGFAAATKVKGLRLDASGSANFSSSGVVKVYKRPITLT